MGARAKPRRIGYVTVKQLAPGKWELRWNDAVEGDRRRRIGTANFDEVKGACDEINTAILERRGFLPSAQAEESKSEVTVSEALLQAVKATAANSATKGKYINALNDFLEFLKKHYPAAAYWSDLKPSMIVGYKNGLKGEYDTKRNLLVPIKRASAYWAAEAPEQYRDYCAAVKRQLKLTRSKQPVIPVLGWKQLYHFLSFLAKNFPELYPLACLQGLAGAREYEAAFVRVVDFCRERGEITFADTPVHKLKTAASERTIPVSDTALTAILDYLQKRQGTAGAADASLFLNKKALPWTPNRLGYAWRVAMAAARKEPSLKLPPRFAADHLRHTFTTLAYDAGCRDRSLQRYLGHAAPDVMGKHYLHISVSQLRQEVVVPFTSAWELERTDSSNESALSTSSAHF